VATAHQTETPRITMAQAGGGWLSRTFLPPWWLLLITGVAWIVVSIILLRFDYVSVYSISLLFGFVAIAAGILEIGAAFMAPGWWKLLNAILALVFIVAGVLAFVSPGDTFVSLAAIFSFVLIFAGSFDIVMSISSRKDIEVWWLQLIGGIIEIALGFWAAGYYGQRRSPGRLGGRLRAHPRREGHRGRLPRPRVAAPCPCRLTCLLETSVKAAGWNPRPQPGVWPLLWVVITRVAV
jgi:uncharacterized membrane protein HdeD (DUF308 family)